MSVRHFSSVKKSTNVRLFLFHRTTSLLSRLAPSLAARLAERLFVTTTRATPPARELEWAATATRSSVPGRNGPLTVWTWGSGDRLALLMHGWSGRGLQLAALAAPLVERGFRVVTFDAPGHGESPGSRSSLPEIAGAAADVANAFGPVEMVVAHSLGAAAALLAVTREGLECGRLVLVAPAGRLSDIGLRFSELSGFSMEVVDRMRQRLEQRLDFKWSEIEPVALIEELELPILVVHDRGDRETQWRDGKRLSAASSEGRFISTSGLGHRRILRDPTVLEIITDFSIDTATQKVA